MDIIHVTKSAFVEAENEQTEEEIKDEPKRQIKIKLDEDIEEEETTTDTCKDLLRDQLSIFSRLKPLATKHYENEIPRIKQLASYVEIVALQWYQRSLPYFERAKESTLKKINVFISWILKKKQNKKSEDNWTNCINLPKPKEK